MDEIESKEPKRWVRNRRQRIAIGCGIALALLLCVGAAIVLSRFVFSDDSTAKPPEAVIAATVPVVEGGTSDGGSLATRVATEEAPAAGGIGAGRIVFVDEGGGLGTVGANGEDPHSIGGQTERVFLFPAWSPDGSNIAALGASESGGGVYVLPDEVGGAVEELYFSPVGAPIYLYWQPDGEAVSFIASGEESLNLYLSPITGGTSLQLLAVGQPLYWDWVGDESRLLVHAGTPLAGARLSLVEAADGTTVDAGPDEPGYFQAPGVSPDGVNLAYAELDRVGRWLAVQNVASGDVQRIAHEGVLAIGWSPTEQKLAFISPPENEPSASANYYGPLHLFDAETGEVSILTDEIVLAFFWSPGGESIAYFTLTQGAGEQVAMTAIDDGSSSHGKRQQQHDDLLLSLSTIGVSGGQPNHLVDFQPTELFVTQFLPFFDQYALSHRLWSPMSDALVLPIVDQEVAKIFVVPTNGRGLRYVADGVMAFWSPQ